MTYHTQVCNKSNTTKPLVELLTLPELIPVFLWGSCYSIFSCLCSVLSIIVCPFVLLRLSIVLSVLLFTAFNYPYGIFKPFLETLSRMFVWNTYPFGDSGTRTHTLLELIPYYVYAYLNILR